MPGLPDDTRVRTVTTSGTIVVDRVIYKIDVAYAFWHVLVISEGNQPGSTITVVSLDGEILAEHTRPPAGITYVGNGRPPRTRPRKHRLSPKS